MLMQDKFANTCNGFTSYDNRAELMNITLSYNELLSMKRNERANDANDEINLRSPSSDSDVLKIKTQYKGLVS